MASDTPRILSASVADEQQDALLEHTSGTGTADSASGDLHLAMSLSGIGRGKRIRTQSEMFPFKPTENRQMFHDYYRKRRDLFHNPPWLNGFHSRALCIISQYLRDIILGLNDGLVSTFLLVFGMYGGGALARSILLAGIMGALAGSISMAIGEFVATKSQLQIVSSDIMSERRNLVHHRPTVLLKLRSHFAAMGYEGELLNRLVADMETDDERLLRCLYPSIEEDADHRNPIVSMLIMGCLVLCGASPSVAPFFFINNDMGPSAVSTAVVIAGSGCCALLFTVGAVKCRLAKANWVWGGFENLLYGVIGAVGAWLVGLVFNQISPMAAAV